ncbi:MAG: DUF6644 family protein [Caulobacteraceae bacterium]
MRQAFIWFGHTPVGVYMRDSTNGFAVVETVHLLGLALLGGVILLLSFGVLNVAVAGGTPSSTARSLRPVFAAGLATMLVSGVLLVASKPLRYFLSAPFRWKIALLVLGVAVYAWLDRKLADPGQGAASRTERQLAVLLLITWFGVGLAGRLIGLL